MTTILYHQGYLYADRRVVANNINFTYKILNRRKLTTYNTNISFAATGNLPTTDINKLIHCILRLAIQKKRLILEDAPFDDIKDIRNKLDNILLDSKDYLPSFIGGSKDYIFCLDLLSSIKPELRCINPLQTHAIGADAVAIYTLVELGIKPEEAYKEVASYSPYTSAEIDKERLKVFRDIRRSKVK